MNKSVRFPAIAFDLLQAQLIWMLWYIGIMVLIDIVRVVVFNTTIDTFYNQSFVASNIFMLVIGIIAIYFLPYYVEHGVTRRNYFIGNIIASICLSILIPVFSYVVTLLEGLFYSNLKEAQLTSIPEIDSNVIGDIFQSILLAPYIDVETNILLSFAVYSLNIFIFYIIGWLISAAFYRLGVIVGILTIAVGLLFIVLKDTTLRVALDLPIYKSFSMFSSIPVELTAIIILTVILVSLLLTYLLTKDAPVKV